MSRTPPMITVQQLAVVAKQHAEVVIASGQFFFPQILVCYDRPKEPIQQASYEGDYEEFVDTLALLAAEGPILWLSHTGDSYVLAQALKPDDPLVGELLSGEKRLVELFEDDSPLVTEAISINLVTHEGSVDTAHLPYRRKGSSKVVWTNPANIEESESGAGGRYIAAMQATIEASRRDPAPTENGEGL